MIREYERFSTAAMNAFIGPRTVRYYLRSNLEYRAERERGVDGARSVSCSRTAVLRHSPSSRCERPVTILLSGPAGGVIGGQLGGRASRAPSNLITVDIGGTSADISVVPDGAVRIMNPRDTQVGGYPVLVPMIDLSDHRGRRWLRSPTSTRAAPSGSARVRPVRRSRPRVLWPSGGTEPTVTDAQVVLGPARSRTVPRRRSSKIDPELSRQARSRRNLCGPSSACRSTDAALGVLRVINSNMALAIRANSVAKGRSIPRDYALMAFGGAGPLHGGGARPRRLRAQGGDRAAGAGHQRGHRAPRHRYTATSSRARRWCVLTAGRRGRARHP